MNSLIISKDSEFVNFMTGEYQRHNWRVFAWENEILLMKYLVSNSLGHILIDDTMDLEVITKIQTLTRQMRPHLPITYVYRTYNARSIHSIYENGAFNLLRWNEIEKDSSNFWDYLNEYLKTLQSLSPERLLLITPQNFGNLIGNSPLMQKLYRLIARLMDTDLTVAIYGNSGTGKEIVARLFHQNGSREKKPFVAINCAAVPENLLESELFGHVKGSFTGAVSDRIGKFEFAHGGTIFLDEIGEMSIFLQAKLLRIIEQGEFEKVGSNKTQKADIRLITATNRYLPDEIKKGKFRQDLYYRINVFPLYLPALADRQDDILLLAHRFINKLTHRPFSGISVRLKDFLLTQPWDGNVRDMENLLTRLSVVSDNEILDLHEDLNDGTVKERKPIINQNDINADTGSLSEIEKQHILDTLASCNNNITETARQLGISRMNLYRKLNQYGMNRENQ